MAEDARLDAERAARAGLRRAVDDLRAAEVAAGVRRRSRIAWILLPIALVAVVAAVLAVTMWVRAERAYTDADYQRAAIARVSLLLSPDHRRPDQARRILDGATGEFHDEFAQSADGFTRFIRSQGTAATGTVDGAGVSGRSGDRATVLVSATVEFENDSGATGTPVNTRQFRLRTLLVPADGELKLAAVQYLP
ncbi:hypothetical protein [Gordonia insulae]|uniref:Mce-associated membrane protein n=1 Tax=Gordonia insulae TaxID=2420509 RepID=A0A3G8JTW0_9ACTN|nr:hypothetical protein [Gordonia insulae]AZG48298.1 hypothetical protein D7316_04915 [Gordonia insulae]